MGRGPRRGKRQWRDFWRAWREEQRRLWEAEHEEGWEPGTPPPAHMAHAWREFFHSHMGAWPEKHWAFGGRRFSPWHQGVDVFNPFVASLLSKGGGLLPLVVLQLLSQKRHYGNEIMALISERTGGQWVANPGAIYPLMTMLENQHLVEGEWADPDKRTVRVYGLTEAGQQELERLKGVVKPKLEEAVEVLQKLIDDLNGNHSDDESIEMI